MNGPLRATLKYFDVHSNFLWMVNSLRLRPTYMMTISLPSTLWKDEYLARVVEDGKAYGSSAGRIGGANSVSSSISVPLMSTTGSDIATYVGSCRLGMWLFLGGSREIANKAGI